MKFYKYEEPNHDPVVLSEDQIINSYYQLWSKKMKELGREQLISREKCIEDWCTIHWASEVQMLNEDCNVC